MNARPTQSGIIDPQFLLAAYCSGFFPMADAKTGGIHWYSPDPRGVFDLEKFRVPRSLRQTISKNIFEVRIDQCFEEVIRSCGNREETWISEDIVQSYLQLYKLGYAHSVESWKGDQLAGGLYGVAIGGAFFGESMFSRERDASKVALAALVNRLNDRGFLLLDTQWVTPHLARFGAIEIPRNEYLKRLRKALEKKCFFT
jgi:leucyl/phenylalanyl-tRNA--protein transferase